MRTVILYFILFILFNSCTKDKGSVNFGSYPADIGKIISKDCATSGCHNSKSYLAASEYNLDSWANMFKGSKSGSPVIPFNSKFSALCYYINTYPELGLQNTPVMPLNKTALTYDEVKLIKDWIDSGAPDVNGNVMWGDNPNRRKLYAVNQGCDVVTVFDSESQLPIRYVAVGKPGLDDTPHMVRVSPDSKYWYVIFINNNIIQKFRCSDDSYIGDIPLSPLAAGTGTDNALNWNTINISSDGKRAYCVSWTLNGKVAAVDLENMKLRHFLAVPNNPHAIAIHPDGTKIYVGAQVGNYITEIDTSFTSSNEISLENGMPVSSLSSLDIHDMIVSGDKNSLYITCQKSNDVRVYNFQTGQVTAVYNVGKYPQEIVYSPLKNQYFVSCTYDSTTFSNSMGVVSRIDASGSVTNLKCGYQPHGIEVDDKTKLAYVLSRNIQSTGPAPHHTSQCAGRNGFVNFIDINTFTIINKKYEMSVDPYFICVRP